ncbi:MAG: methyltransferase domain-containing protein [Chloroflexi bacterium]|nr:methyltransferase domain-containing protein [Chloroflexota bacterium]
MIKQQLLRLLKAILLLPVVLLACHTLVRIVRRFHKFPIPQFLANFIDNPLRRRLQPPDATAVRHGVEPGMTVLDVGPGNGRFSIAAARRAGPSGYLHTIDIEPKMIERVQQRAAAEGVTNIEARVASAYELPYPDDFFDLIYMITVTGEIPDPVRALREFRRVLKPSGAVAVSEILVDPDYPRASTVTRWAAAAGLHPVKKIGNFFYYTLVLGLDARQRPAQVEEQ